MAKVALRFVLPEDENIIRLHIWEGATADGEFNEIDSTTQVGTSPHYIDQFTTNNAISETDWFAIQFEDADGIFSDLSAPIKGDTTTLVGELVKRVMLRDASLDENLVLQEAEATVSWIYRVDDPYSIDINTVSPLWLNELANLSLVSVMYLNLTQSSSTSQSYTAGLISETSAVNTQNATKSIENMEKRALRRLGIGGSILAAIDMRPAVISITGVKTAFDSSRILEARAIITEELVERDLETGAIISGN
jgi:hypothetical protein